MPGFLSFYSLLWAEAFYSWRFSSLQLLAVQDLDEGFAKLDVESGVDDRVDSTVEVSQPGDGAVQWGRDAAAPAVGLQHVGQEERQPADDEHTLETDIKWIRGWVYFVCY